MENEAARQDVGSRIEAAKPVRPAMGERLPLVQRSGGIKVEKNLTMTVSEPLL
jgi:hypothetical protein